MKLLLQQRIRTCLTAEEGRLEEIVQEIEKEHFYQEFLNAWEELDPEERARKWPQQMENIVRTAYASRPYCLRCGE